jgi:hypothetical protein
MTNGLEQSNALGSYDAYSEADPDEEHPWWDDNEDE